MESIMEEDIEAVKIGLRLHPPALTLFYKADGKSRIRVMPVRFLNKTGCVGHIVTELKESHEVLNKVANVRIEKMLRLLQETGKGMSLEEAKNKVLAQYNINPDEDMNKLSDSELSRKKNVMEESFVKHQVKAGDEGFEYDVQVDFEKEGKIDAGWDSSSENGEDFWS